MAGDKLTVHITADDAANALFDTMRAMINSMSALQARIQALEAFTEQHQTVLEQHGGRLNALESLPGVREMLPQDDDPQ